jgi:hypothetical protein
MKGIWVLVATYLPLPFINLIFLRVFACKWMELENIILSEASHAKNAKSHMFSLICGR